MVTVQMYLESLGYTWKLIDDPKFIKLKMCLDNKMKENAKKGLGREVCQAEALNGNEIDRLWESGVLGDSNPKQLSDTMLFLIGVNCALRAGKEHKMHYRPGCDSSN